MIISLFSHNQQPAAGSETLLSVSKQTDCVVVEEGGVFYALPALHASR